MNYAEADLNRVTLLIALLGLKASLNALRDICGDVKLVIADYSKLFLLGTTDESIRWRP